MTTYLGIALPGKQSLCFMLTLKKLPGDRFDYIDFLLPGGSRHYPMVR